MGCCLSREDDQFSGSRDALLPKGRNGNKRVENSSDPSHKDSAHGSYKSPSAVVIAADKVPSKPQPSKKPKKGVDLLELNDRPPTPPAAPLIQAASLAEPKLTSSRQQASDTKSSTSSYPIAAPTLLPADEEPLPPPKPTETSLPNEKEASLKTLPVKPIEADDNVVVPAFTQVTIEAMNADNDHDNDDDQENEKDENGNDDAMELPKEPKPKKITPIKKSKKKKKKGKR